MSNFNLRVYNRSKDRIILLFASPFAEESGVCNLTLNIRGNNFTKFNLLGKDLYANDLVNQISSINEAVDNLATKEVKSTLHPLSTYIVSIPVKLNNINSTADLDCLFNINVGGKDFTDRIIIYGENFQKQIKTSKEFSSQMYFKNSSNKWEALKGFAGAIFTKNLAVEKKLDKIIDLLEQINQNMCKDE